MHEPSIDYAMFAVYVGTHKKNIKLCQKLILQEFEKLQDTTVEDLQDAKNFIEGEFLLSNEDNFKMADSLSYFSLCHNAEDALKYVENISKVTLDEFKSAAKRFLTKNYTAAIIEQK
jgi:predicted Zn-dependent peptidase